jgi:capsular polysaccharide export protein
MLERAEADWQIMPPVVFGVCWWNHGSVRAMFGNGKYKPVLTGAFPVALREALLRNGCIIGWASRLTLDNEAACRAVGVPLVRIEDGFLRSVGLGAGLAPAASLVADARGIYYDASRPSDLEWMLEHAELTTEQCAHGAALRQKICAARLSKYNLGRALPCNAFPTDCLRVLVPGQVADDASILSTTSASIDIRGSKNVNIELLKAARRNNPNAFIVYKPHPDVTSDLRNGRIPTQEALQHADRVITDADIVDLLEECDKVETMTSLTGFEALLRGKDVTVHGLPFYAGWGLTVDTTASPRRTQRRNLDELVYLALVAYSRYVHPVNYRPCDAEAMIDALLRLRRSRWLKMQNAVRMKVAWIGDKVNRQFGTS